MSRVIHFEIPAQDVKRAVDFYNYVFDWQAQQWPGSPQEYWLVTTGADDQPGINGAIMARPGPVTNTIEVTNLEEAIAKVEAKGGLVVVDKRPIPGVGWLCYCKDTEENIFGMMQSDPAAG